MLAATMNQTKETLRVQTCLLHIITERWLYDRAATDVVRFLQKNKHSIISLRQYTINEMKQRKLSLESDDAIVMFLKEAILHVNVDWNDINKVEQERLQEIASF